MALNDANGTDQVWLTIGTAADAAGVARRSAFRWAAAGAVPIRHFGSRRCVEVGALRRFAVNRLRGRAMALVPAISPEPGAIPPSPVDEETIEALSEGLVCSQELAQALLIRVDRIERMLGIQEK